MPNPYSDNLGTSPDLDKHIVMKQAQINAIMKGLRVSPTEAANMQVIYEDLVFGRYPKPSKGLIKWMYKMDNVISKNITNMKNLGRGMLGVYPMVSQALGFSQQLNEIKARGGVGQVDAFGNISPFNPEDWVT